MTLNSSGPISLAGATAGVSIEIENGGNGTTTISLNDAAVRTLAGVPSGAITMPTNFYGKSNRVVKTYTFTSSTTNAALNISSITGYVAGKTDITVTVNSGVYLWSNSTGTYGLNLTGGTTGDTLTLVNNGFIMGQGGVGAQIGGGNSGGPALNIGTGINITINNVSYIGGGGGGGGARHCYGGGGGGGGAGGGTGGNNQCSGLGGNGGTIGSSGAGGVSSTGGACCYSQTTGSGGGGGRILPGSGGGGGCGGGGPGVGGGAGGGGGGFGNNQGSNGSGGNGGSTNGAGGGAQSYAGGGGGGWGASGGGACGAGGGGGGKAINKNGKTVTFSAGCTRVYGAVS